MTASARTTAITASLLGFTGVVLGAFGAHALKETLTANGTTAVWQTAVLYHLVHAVAVLAVGGWAGHWPKVLWVSRCWTGGVLLFSGSLYWLALGGPKFLGPVTPLGGAAFLAGWGLLAWNGFKQSKT